MTLTLAMPSWGQVLARILELRIDVSLSPGEVERELDTLHDRIRQPGDKLHDMPVVPTALPGVRLRYREADGEYYVYVEDTRYGRIAGYTVFNRLIEVSRRTDRVVRAPHTKLGPAYQRCGLATSIYGWALDGGLCPISGARQSAGANALWGTLARRHTRGYVDLRDKSMTYLGESVSETVQADLHTRMILLGQGWTLSSFADATGMR